MPIPKVKPREEQDAYVSRCMGAIGSEYDDNKQAVAVCMDSYRRGKKDLEDEAKAKPTDSPVVQRSGDQVVAGQYREDLNPEDLPPHLRRRDLRPDDLELKQP